MDSILVMELLFVSVCAWLRYGVLGDFVAFHKTSRGFVFWAFIFLSVWLFLCLFVFSIQNQSLQHLWQQHSKSPILTRNHLKGYENFPNNHQLDFHLKNIQSLHMLVDPKIENIIFLMSEEKRKPLFQENQSFSYNSIFNLVMKKHIFLQKDTKGPSVTMRGVLTNLPLSVPPYPCHPHPVRHTILKQQKQQNQTTSQYLVFLLNRVKRLVQRLLKNKK